MRIGLIRHFPVELRLPSGWRTAEELYIWRQQYDASPVIRGKADLHQSIGQSASAAILNVLL